MIFGMIAISLYLAKSNLYMCMIISVFFNAPLLNPAIIFALSRKNKLLSERQIKLFKVILTIAIPYIVPVFLLPSISIMIQYIIFFSFLSLTTLVLSLLFVFDRQSPIVNSAKIKKYCSLYYVCLILIGISTFWLPAPMFS